MGQVLAAMGSTASSPMPKDTDGQPNPVHFEPKVPVVETLSSASSSWH